MIKHLLVVLLAVLCITKSNGQENPTPGNSSVFEKTDAYLKSMVDSLEIVGLNYMVLIDHEIVNQKASRPFLEVLFKINGPLHRVVAIGLHFVKTKLFVKGDSGLHLFNTVQANFGVAELGGG